jgi:hypothetical protein
MTAPIPVPETRPPGAISSSVAVPLHSDPLLQLLQRTSHRLAKFDVYVDDYLGLVQCTLECRREVIRTLLHAMDQVFCPVDLDGSPACRELASVKKLKKGDAYWETRKHILGWLLTVACVSPSCLTACSSSSTVWEEPLTPAAQALVASPLIYAILGSALACGVSPCPRICPSSWSPTNILAAESPTPI